MAQVEQKRIGQITKLEGSEITTLIKSKAEAAKWAMAVDYVVPDIEPNEGEGDEPQVTALDKGTTYITMDRIGLLTASGLVPQNMLPNRVADVKNGTMSIPSSGTKWVFTEEGGTGTEYVNEDPTGSQVLATIDTIYRDKKTFGQRAIYTQYRYVAVEETVGTPNESGVFVPIPNDLVMVDGEGTVVNDNAGAYTRQVDINIGTPDRNAVAANILAIQNHKLVHTVSGVIPPNDPPTKDVPRTQTNYPGFGASFNATSMTVNTTGHVTAASDVPITIPSTPARSGTAGLIKIGTDSDVQPISANNSIGTIPPSASDYVLVAAADHTHKAEKFILTNTNDGTKTYDGTNEVEYNFDYFLQAKLPVSGPSSAGLFLVSTLDNGVAKTSWADPQSIIHPRYAFIPVTGGSTSGSALSIGTPTAKSDDMSVANNELNGLLAGKTFIVTYSIGITTPANTYLDDLKVSVMEGNTEKSSATHVVNESINPMSNYVNGTLLYVPGTTKCTFKITNIRTGVTWTASSGTIQVAEVK